MQIFKTSSANRNPATNQVLKRLIKYADEACVPRLALGNIG